MKDNLGQMDGHITIFYLNGERYEFFGKWAAFKGGWILFIADDGRYIQAKADDVYMLITKKREPDA